MRKNVYLLLPRSHKSPLEQDPIYSEALETANYDLHDYGRTYYDSTCPWTSILSIRTSYSNVSLITSSRWHFMRETIWMNTTTRRNLYVFSRIVRFFFIFFSISTSSTTSTMTFWSQVGSEVESSRSVCPSLLSGRRWPSRDFWKYTSRCIYVINIRLADHNRIASFSSREGTRRWLRLSTRRRRNKGVCLGKGAVTEKVSASLFTRQFVNMNYTLSSFHTLLALSYGCERRPWQNVSWMYASSLCTTKSLEYTANSSVFARILQNRVRVETRWWKRSTVWAQV